MLTLTMQFISLDTVFASHPDLLGAIGIAETTPSADRIGNSLINKAVRRKAFLKLLSDLLPLISKNIIKRR
jgi:hypothetical protein